jgi:hypothetical protein
MSVAWAWWLVGWPLVWLASVGLLAWLARDKERWRFFRNQARRRKLERVQRRARKWAKG